MGTQTSNMGDDAAQIKALMGQLFEVIDVDGSGAIEEKEIKAAVLALFGSVGAAKSEEEQAMVLGGAMFFLAGIGQLSESLGEDATACTESSGMPSKCSPSRGCPK